MSGIPRVYVGNLPRDCRERDIDKFLKGYGHVRDVTMKNGFCFVVCLSHTIAYWPLLLSTFNIDRRFPVFSTLCPCFDRNLKIDVMRRTQFMT